jgi:transcriptional regulator with XRE-family HTH domain
MSPIQDKDRGGAATFSGRIYALRKAHNHSQAGLAKELRQRYPDMRVSDSAIHSWERMDRSPVGRDMLRLAEFFHVDVQWLQFGLTGARENGAVNVIAKKLQLLKPEQIQIVHDMVDALIPTKET